MLSFPVKERGRDKKCSMFYCKKMFVGTDSSTLQKGLQNRSELVHWILYCHDCFCFPCLSAELFPQLEGDCLSPSFAHREAVATGLGFWELGMSCLLRALVFSNVWNGGLSDWIPALGLMECSAKGVAVFIYIWFGLKQEQICRWI